MRDWEEDVGGELAAGEDWDEESDVGIRRAPGGRGAAGTRRMAVEAKPSPELVEALKAWRLAEARRRRVPAFRILTDRVLGAIAATRPEDSEALMAIQGVGPKLTERYGAQILALVSRGR